MMQAERIEHKLIDIVLVLPEDERFKLPASTQPGSMTVTRLKWAVTGSNNQSHPITASAVDDGGIQWTLSLRMSDVPLHVRSALVSACQEGDI